MISDDITSLADWLLGLHKRSQALPHEYLADLAAVLADYAAQVRALESQPFIVNMASIARSRNGNGVYALPAGDLA